ncbi:DUF5753 domain-containing protein [Actinomadura yumaensis]|uniref:DUF5753 domain-containing protein n=1 Tax=Actinomadura TaxID=1988 RepID=UPI0013263597|nr:DUF5753 domain-containing protein [Actinomadura sp. J1-007]MWK36748.1 hypothetical protein [Actinomadura sp. J1-007]
MGEIIGVTASQVSNLEAARSQLQIEQAESLDLRWKTDGHLTRMVRQRDRPHDPDWWNQYVVYERQAERIESYNALVVPGLLQTEPYMRALFEVSVVVTDIDAAVRDRLARQESLRKKDPLELRFLIKESALLDPIGGKEVMREQLAYLLEVSRWPNVVLRVVSRDIGAHVGVDGSFQLLHGGKRVAAYIEAVGGGRLVVTPSKVAGYRRRYDTLMGEAQPRRVSEGLIRDAMEG